MKATSSNNKIYSLHGSSDNQNTYVSNHIELK